MFPRSLFEPKALTAAVCIAAAAVGCKREAPESLDQEAFPRRPTTPLQITPQVLRQEAALANQLARQEPNLSFFGLPESQRHVTVLTNEGFIIGYDEKRRLALWAMYLLKRTGEIGENHTSSRSSGFSVDDRVENPMPANFLYNTGYDHGHLVPADAMYVIYGPSAERYAARMPNVVAETPHLNRAVVAKLERTEQNYWAPAFTNVWVITGPAFDKKPQFIEKKSRGTEIEWEIPDAIFKIWVRVVDRRVDPLAVVLPQNAQSTNDISSFLRSIDFIEEITELNVLPNLPQPMQNVIESQEAKELWQVKKPHKPRASPVKRQ